MDDILAKTSFSKRLYNKAARALVETFRQSPNNPRAMFGHWVGISTHDVGQDIGPLRGEMVFTIEPVFRVSKEEINICREGLIDTTEGGTDILSDFVPLTVDRIQKQMLGNGLLQDHPRARPEGKQNAYNAAFHVLTCCKCRES
jgi:Xaa-Pro aminopeptidase